MLRRLAPPSVVLLASLLLTAAAAYTLSESTRARDDEAFRNAVQATQDRIEARMDTYIALLRGTAGLINAEQENVSEEAFRAYAERLRINHFYPGVQGIGFTRRLETPAEAAALLAERRRRLPGYRLWPDATGPERHAIVYLHPLDRRNLHALGYDMHSEPVRREAMDRARDTGTSALSGRVTLVQEIEGRTQAGFLLYAPVFRQSGDAPATRAERRRLLVGYAYAPFRADDLFEGIFGTEARPRTAFRIFDGHRADSTALLHDSRTGGIAPAANPARTDTTTLEVAGRTWTITFAATPSFSQARDSYTWQVLSGGLLLSLLLFGLSSAQARAQKTTEQSERRLRVILESLPVAVAVADPDGRVTFRNAHDAAFEQPGEFYYHETHERVPAEDLPLARALRGERVEGQILDVARPGGLRRTVLTSAFPVLGPDGVLQMALSAVVDVTDQKRAEERAAQLRRHTQELERSNRELQEFAYVASHDLQEPLRKITAFSDLVRREYGAGLGEEGAYYVGRIQDSAGRMSNLIKDLLAFSRVSTQTRAFTDVPLDTVLEDVTQDLWARLQETGGRVEAGALPTLHADPTQMRQLFQNLIGNALKFHRPGTPPEVHVRAERTRLTAPDGLGYDGWRLTVSDNGIGFDEKYAARIFAPFQRLHTRGEYEGTGIGLAICRRIVEHHGGTISAASTPGQGATFIIELPGRPFPDAVPTGRP